MDSPPWIEAEAEEELLGYGGGGDRHQSSIAKTGVKDWGILFDITASPINEPASAAEEDASFEGKAYAGESFGFAQIDWHDKKMSLQIRDAANKVINSVSFKIK